MTENAKTWKTEEQDERFAVLERQVERLVKEVKLLQHQVAHLDRFKAEREPLE